MISGACAHLFPATPNPSHRRPSRVAKWFGVSVLALALAACGSSDVNYSVPMSASTASPRGTLAVGDVIRVTYPGAPELNQSIKIQPDGKVGLPMVGSVNASGRPAASLQSSLTAMYQPHLNDPTVFVSLDQPAASIYVSGEVAKPGKVPLDRSFTALEAVMEVGGFSRLANPKKVYVIRTEGGKQRRFVLNLAAPLSGSESQAFYLRPYDVVFVERSNW
jgi:polysaccharide biosynthesis/export protein